MSETTAGKLEKLKRNLLKITSKQFEELVASLISELLQVPIYLAKSGFQFGADAGTAGNDGRHLRVECKQYDKTVIDDRELRGEIDDSLLINESLEAWILASTQALSLQSANKLDRKSEDVGVPIIIIDWQNTGFPVLAALCCVSPDIIGSQLSEESRAIVESLTSDSTNTLNQLKTNFDSWSLGLRSLARDSHKKLKGLWNSASESNAYFHQNIAGGVAKVIKRQNIDLELNAWYETTTDEPFGLLGNEGVGKTWAAITWIHSNEEHLPVSLVIPSSKSFNDKPINETSIIELVGDKLSEITKSQRKKSHWHRRVELLLKRPRLDGPIFLLLIDGLNQEPSIDWTALFKSLQGDLFAGRVKVIFTCRNSFFNDKLHHLRGLISKPKTIQVTDYDDAHGSELDQKLALDGLTREEFQDDVLTLARNPRLFNLVVNLKGQLNGSTEVTVHRLLWEYGKDSMGVRSVASFSEGDWQIWLKDMAKYFATGIKEYSIKEIGESTARPDLSFKEVQARISDIIDGNFTEKNPDSGNHQFNPKIVAHALGLALLVDVLTVKSEAFEDYESRLNSWLDPISGLDERSEILRAAVSILLIKNPDTNTRLAGALVSAWLNTQNLANSHRDELFTLAIHLVEPLLDTIEHSDSYAQDSARVLALNALKLIPKNHAKTYESFIARSCKWLKTISMDFPYFENQKEQEDYHSKRMVELLGKVEFGEWSILGKQFTLTRNSEDSLANSIPSLLEGFPLEKAIPVFELAAISISISYKSKLWNNLKWLVHLNEIDTEKTIIELRKLSFQLHSRPTEFGINKKISNRAAALTRWLSPFEEDEVEAGKLNDNFYAYETYEQNYLTCPAESYFQLEWRHAKEALLNTNINLRTKLQKIQKFILDPRFEIPDAFKAQVEHAGKFTDVSKLETGSQYTMEDHDFESLELALARCTPKTLARLMRKKLMQMEKLPAHSRFRRAVASNKHMILAGVPEKNATKHLRLSSQDTDTAREWVASSFLFKIELHDQPAMIQAETLLQADVENICIDIYRILKPLSVVEAEELVAKYGNSKPAKIAILIFLLIETPVDKSESVWSWLINLAKGENEDLRKLSFRNLAIASSERFGQFLISEDWTWEASKAEWENHYGSLALIYSTKTTSFELIAHKIAPWLILEAIKLRGNLQDELRIALSIVNKSVLLPSQDVPDLGSYVIIDQSIQEQYLQAKKIKPIESGDLKEYFDTDDKTRLDRYNQSLDTAMSRITEARMHGASFYLFSFGHGDLDLVIEHSPTSVAPWIEGLDTLSADFRKRINLSCSFYISLCESLLKFQPELGTKLWRGLETALHSIRFNSEASVLTLLHILFRAPTSEPLSLLREEILNPEHSKTDMDLFSIALAAQMNGHSDWLDEMISKDQASLLPWKNKRAIVLQGFVTNDPPSIEDTWPSGPIASSYEELRLLSAYRRNIEACNKFWWNAYLQSTNPDDAYAAWLLFMHTADRRIWQWYPRNHSRSETNSFENLKLLHAELNIQELDRTIEKQEKVLKETYLGMDLPSNFGVWAV